MEGILGIILVVFAVAIIVSLIPIFNEVLEAFQWAIDANWFALSFSDIVVVIVFVIFTILFQIFVFAAFSEADDKGKGFSLLIAPFVWLVLNLLNIAQIAVNSAFGSAFSIFYWRTIGDLGSIFITAVFAPLLFGFSLTAGYVDGQNDKSEYGCEGVYATAQALGISTLNTEILKIPGLVWSLYRDPLTHDVWMLHRQARNFLDTNVRTLGGPVYWVSRAGQVLGCIPFLNQNKPQVPSEVVSPEMLLVLTGSIPSENLLYGRFGYVDDQPISEFGSRIDLLRSVALSKEIALGFGYEDKFWSKNCEETFILDGLVVCTFNVAEPLWGVRSSLIDVFRSNELRMKINELGHVDLLINAKTYDITNLSIPFFGIFFLTDRGD